MLLWLLLLFTLVPLLELYLLVIIGKWMGLMPTLTLVLFTGVAGAIIARRAGRSNLRQIQKQLNRGTIPSDELLGGLIILISGALLITPGILTDLMGFAGLFSPTRKLGVYLIKQKFEQHIEHGSGHFHVFFGGKQADPEPEKKGKIKENNDDEGIDYDIDVTPDGIQDDDPT